MVYLQQFIKNGKLKPLPIVNTEIKTIAHCQQ
ncbi:hypothetical protein Leryth_005338 [Lithospermum erythrorhizon]|nr:hypothetical protein Leryth_005338 [Lithospermum erythrorhizon]